TIGVMIGAHFGSSASQRQRPGGGPGLGACASAAASHAPSARSARSTAGSNDGGGGVVTGGPFAGVQTFVVAEGRTGLRSAHGGSAKSACRPRLTRAAPPRAP